MNFNFGEVLTRAWQIIWKHKILWIFGVMAGCGRGGGGNGGGGGDTRFEGQGPQLPPQVTQWFQSIADNLTTFMVIAIALFCLIWIVVIFLNTIGRIGLIRGASQADGGMEHLNFGQLFSESMPYFWRMFGLSLIIALPLVFVFGVFFAALIAFAISASGGDEAALGGMLTMIPLVIICVCILIPVGFVVGMIVRQAERAIVLEDMRTLPALGRGWEVFRANLGPIILTAIILIVIGLVAGFVIALPIFIVVVPGMMSFMAGGGESTTPLALMAICLCLYAPVSLLLNGVAAAYSETVWTLTFLRLTKPQESAPVIVEANA